MMLWQFGLLGPNGIDPTTITAPIFLALTIRVVEIALGLIGTVALIYVVVAGIQYITAAGDVGKQTAAKQAIVAAVIGMIIVAGAFLITNEVLQRLQFDATIIQGTGTQPIQKLFK